MMLETTIKKLTEQLERVADALEKANAIVDSPCKTGEPNEPAEIDEPEADEAEEEEAPAPPKKRGRGRPKKTEKPAPEPEDDDDDDDEDEEEAPEPPKKRGRRKKKPAPEPEPEPEDDDDDDEDDDDDDDDDDDEDDDLEEEVTRKTVVDHIRKFREALVKENGPRGKVPHVKLTKKLLKEYNCERIKDVGEDQLGPFFEELKAAEDEADLL